ncbi:hypothetical protein C0Z18_30800 [Trinickia dabaoshanensis]|uniref:Uncharacterized protein n=1 Tax=Trinickia dabaoshanensis TaxID=564714 RepID=A0A2N7VBU0_9BURK|nr:hypothetical protein [Trinickia dabaoshanensis]PMS14638.1 hypothetical protein C0Z18_30800 [Trinickia dabaoshanensis]
MKIRFRSRPGYWRALAFWSVLCAVISQWHFQHVLFICEHVEAFYNGMANDETVVRAMRALLAVVWVVGMAVFTACWRVIGLTGRASNK